MTTNYTPIEVAVALSLYGYNVDAYQRASKIYKHFEGNCTEVDELILMCQNYGSVATAMAMPSALVYVEHALEKYGEEAKERVEMNSR